MYYVTLSLYLAVVVLCFLVVLWPLSLFHHCQCGEFLDILHMCHKCPPETTWINQFDFSDRLKDSINLTTYSAETRAAEVKAHPQFNRICSNIHVLHCRPAQTTIRDKALH